jgi:phage terminase small subunit
MGLTTKQRDFCRFYVENQSAHRSAIQAGYSEQYAKSKSGTLLDNLDVVAEIKRLRDRMNERAEKSATDVVNEYARVAFTDRTSFLKEDPLRPGELMFKAPDELTDDQKALVERVNVSRREIDTEQGKVWRQEYSYVLLDKANALQQMGRHFGIFDDKLKLIQSQQNPFKNASPQQLEQLKKSFVGIMSGEAIDGEYKEVTHVLPHDKGRAGTGR